MSNVLSLLNVPTEVLRLIALNLEIDDLFSFQGLCAKYFTETYPMYTIEEVILHSDRIEDSAKVVKRLCENNLEFTHYFFIHRRFSRSQETKDGAKITGCELERIGYEIGHIFTRIYDELYEIRGGATFKDSADTSQWHSFEDHLLVLFPDYMGQHDNKNKNMKGAEFWLTELDPACKKNCSHYADALIRQTILEISRAIAAGSIHLEDVAEHLRDLKSKLNDIVKIAYLATVIGEARYERLPVLAKLYKFLLKEIIGKRRHNYGSFFQILVSDLNHVIGSIVVKDETIEEYLDIFKDCLKWRFVVPNGDWRRLDVNALRVCMVDDTIRDIFFSTRVCLSYHWLQDITNIFRTGCSVNFRTARGKYLFSENVPKYNPHVGASRTEYRRRARLQELKFGDTGKTRLADLLAWKLKNQGKLRALVAGRPGVPFEEKFHADIKMDFRTFMTSALQYYRSTGKSTYLIVDDAQVYFQDPFTGQSGSSAQVLWNYLKDITSIGYIKLYCFASYGEIDLQNPEISSAFYSCPFEISPASKLDLGFMKFSDDKMLEYAEKYRSKLWPSLSSEKMQHIACMARDLSNGHPGIFSSILKLMRSEFSPFADDVLTQ
ncbi:hypothetical protein MP638_005132 [Amoeboaphelidium occidentale]|nr:hypothetical protein MP638_005132 [Amoeboaphelidium occidentale]